MIQPEAVLIIGAYGSGKSSAVEEMADILEKRGTPYAALDLDWLAWFDVGDDEIHDRIFWRNLAAVVANYREVGVRCFLLAHSIESRDELDRYREVLDMPLHVIRLTLDIGVIRARLRTAVTTGRAADLDEAEIQIDAGTGTGLEDFALSNDGPIQDVAAEILERIGWRR